MAGRGGALPWAGQSHLERGLEKPPSLQPLPPFSPSLSLPPPFLQEQGVELGNWEQEPERTGKCVRLNLVEVEKG